MPEVTIALVHSDPIGGITFMVQTMNEHEVYRVIQFGEVASVFVGDRELWNCGSPNICKTFKAYLRRRFHRFQIMDFSGGI